MKEIDPSHPVALCNGDVLFIDIIAEECPDIDIYGTNTYRGVSFGDMFQVVREKLDKPLMFTEFGAVGVPVVCDCEHRWCVDCGREEHWPITCTNFNTYNKMLKQNGTSIVMINS